MKNKKKYVIAMFLLILFFGATLNSIACADFQKIKNKNSNTKLFQNDNDIIRSPAEFEPVSKLIIIWPKWWSTSDGFRQINYYLDLINESEDITQIDLYVNNNIIKQRVKNLLNQNNIPLKNITITNQYTRTIWVRDYGPFFIEKNNELSIVDFYFFGYTYTLDLMDNFFPLIYSIKYKITYNSLPTMFIGLQGGNYMSDGNGTGFIGDRVFYEDNPRISKDTIIMNIKKCLGLKDLIILKSQNVSIKDGGDGTGHIDMFSKIINKTIILVGKYNDTTDPNYQTLEENANLLTDWGYNVIRIPMLRNPQNNKVIWTYTNSLIVNNGEKKIVLVPQYNTPEDQTAISIYKENMPEYEIRGINCTTIIKSSGAIHCTTMTVPTV